jgi:hypothetical protein
MERGKIVTSESRNLKATLSDILQNTWQVLFRSVKVMKIKERQKLSQIVRQFDNKMQCGMWYRTLEQNDHASEKPRKSQVCRLPDSIISTLMLIVVVTQVKRKLNEGYVRTCYTVFYSINLKLFKNKEVNTIQRQRTNWGKCLM